VVERRDVTEPIDATKAWIALVAIGATAFLFRASFHLVHERVRLAPWLVRALNYVPPAVVAALLLPGLLRVDEGAAFPVARLLAAVFAFFVARLTRNLLVTIGLGLGALLGLTALGL
jgi:branched-subunit amino acid transport protein